MPFKIPEFVNSQTPGVQTTLMRILARQPSLGMGKHDLKIRMIIRLEEFYKEVLEMESSLKDRGKFRKWAADEYL